MTTSIIADDAIPKYYQLASILKNKIDAGDWPPHTPIPSERDLEVQYFVSRTTIRHAIEYLERQGYVYREHGRGTFVSPQKLQKGAQELTSFSEDLLRRGMTPSQIIRSIEYMVPPDTILRKLELPEDSKVYCIVRVRFADDIPIGLQTSYLSLPENQPITREDLESTGSLYRILQEKYNIIPSEADETLEVTLATPEEAALLEIKTGAPLLLNERLMYNQNRRAIEFVKILYRGDRYRYLIRLTR